MPSKDLHHNIRVEQLLKPATVTTDATPANGLDTFGFESAELVALIGQSGDTLSGSVKLDVVLEDSDDDSTYAAVTNADYVLVDADGVTAEPDSSGIIATVDAAAEDETKVRIGYRGPKRYCRLKFDLTGTHSNGIPVAELGILGHPRHGPCSDA